MYEYNIVYSILFVYQIVSRRFPRTLADLPEHMELNEGTHRRRGKDPDDIFVCVKRYISSVEMRQPPLLVLVPENRDKFTLMTNRSFLILYVKFFTICLSLVVFFQILYV